MKLVLYSFAANLQKKVILVIGLNRNCLLFSYFLIIILLSKIMFIFLQGPLRLHFIQNQFGYQQVYSNDSTEIGSFLEYLTDLPQHQCPFRLTN